MVFSAAAAAAAAKSLQSCLTLWDPIDGSPPGSPVPGILQARTLECVSICGFLYFLQFKSEFGNKELMIWATVNSQSCFCWLYRASPSSAVKNIISLVSVLTIWWWPSDQKWSNEKITSCLSLLPIVNTPSRICLVLFTLQGHLIVHSFVLFCCSEFRTVSCQRVSSSKNF